MSRLRAIAVALGLVTIPACRIVLDDTVEASSRTCSVGTVVACTDASSHQELSWLEMNVFPNCTFSGCHNGAMTDAGRLDFQPGKAYASLVNVDSKIASGAALVGKAKIVTPMEPAKSYLLVMLRQLTPAQHDPPLDNPPASVGFMPQNAGGAVTCCQKLDAITRWIEEGAQNN
jgi:hypothetical protein